jgi:transcription-repair coupling factor (superfamily II helicase)
MLDKVFQSASLQALKEQLKENSSFLIEHLWDCPKAVLCLFIQKATKKNICIVSGKKDDRFLQNFLFLQGKDVLDLPPRELLSSEGLPCSPDLLGKRFETLYLLANHQSPQIIHCELGAFLQKTLPPKTLLSLCSHWKKGDALPFQELPLKLQELGYQRCSTASDKGEFAVRGGIIDIFPIASSDPFRIDFFGDQIDSIRIYDPISQKSIQKVDELFLCPASEIELLQKPATKLATLLEYLGPDTFIILDDLLAIEDQYIFFKSLMTNQNRLFFSLEEFLEKLPNFSHMFLLEHAAEDLSEVSIPKKQGRSFYTGENPFQPLSFRFFDRPFTSFRFHSPFEEVSPFFCRLENKESANLEEILQGISRHHKEIRDLCFVASAASEEKMIEQKLEELEIQRPNTTTFAHGYLSSGFVLPEISFACVPTAELTQRRKMRRQKWRTNHHNTLSDYLQLIPGDIVVHFHHGIGKFLGIEKLPNHQQVETEYLHLEYADHGKIYVPVTQSHLVTRYVGAKEESVTFNTLGSKKWQNTYQKTQTAILGYAKQLLERAAERSIQPGFAYPMDSLDMEMFEEEFSFVETEDQKSAILALKQDMYSEKSMDRLICGDVGYGKTEVAMRAAFKAACDGKKQVAVLVPTTVLAIQHYETFVARMANFPIRIAAISRFCTAKESKEILQKVELGEIDILIGTHRLISKDVRFHDLGLLIIDEEQRFGVRAKEHLKAMKCGVDCLTLSATPIPRTLYMSLIGIKEVSVISTPPQDRLPIQTIIAERNSELIQNALVREFSRDGQAFFIHNRVETLPRVQEEIRKLVPQAKIVSGHGQMDPEEIDAVFHSFKQGNSDLLLSTTIVENGIDIPNANTILIDRADQFGMADLYQLRGRVGRWNRPAYAYLLVNKLSTLSELAKKRLEALADSSGYGGGLKIAMKDLEIRGAGDILGEQQSGQVAAIGFHLYCKLLKKTIEAIKKQRPLQSTETKMEYSLNAKIPEEYIPESEIRMELYYRLGNLASPEEVQEILSEINDRFGPAPEPVKLLCLFTRLRLFASELNLVSLKVDKTTFRMEKMQGSKTVNSTALLPSLKDLNSFEGSFQKILKDFASKKIH